MTNFPVNPHLPDNVLECRTKLPVKPASITLSGRYIELKTTDLKRDAVALYEVSNGKPATLGSRSIDAYDEDQLIWRYMGGGPFASATALSDYLRFQVEANNGLCLTVFDRATGRAVGVVNYMNNLPTHLKVELGNIWYSPLVQGGKANTEATYLLLNHAFTLGYRRLEWKCDALNERSRRAALRMGFTFEGIQECHFIMKGRSRDTAWFRLLDREWLEAKARLEKLLNYQE